MKTLAERLAYHEGRIKIAIRAGDAATTLQEINRALVVLKEIAPNSYLENRKRLFQTVRKMEEYR